MAGQQGYALTLNSALKMVWAAIVATAGGTATGALQYRGADGKVAGTYLLQFGTTSRVLKVGSAGLSGKFEVVASESVLEAQDNQKLEILLNTNMESALEIKDKTTGKMFLKARTKTNDEVIVAVEKFDTDALIGVSYKVRQGKVVTTSTVKAFLQQPNTSSDILITMPFNGNALLMVTNIMGVDADGLIMASIEMKSTFRKSGGAVSQVGRPPS
ncbi:hypothetical protein [Rufibacter hautae]|uniref:Uncharacterized protein n=1 Tax=Rufibacter hautae TaxID=2595005 RepID=A0A5B6TE90_9BACT|nr:hypothetical protein [Rufibacter hautae]KAA3438458.1 hypothetical protein FOA19_14580 [Rufibacter hautae]